VTHLEAMSASAASDPLASIDFRTFLAEFADGFGITEEPD